MTIVRGPVTVYINPLGVSSLSSNVLQRGIVALDRDRSTFVEARVVAREDDARCEAEEARTR